MPSRSAPARTCAISSLGWRANKLKTLETEANAIKAAILLYQETGDQLLPERPRRRATRLCANGSSIRRCRCYTTYVFDDGQRCTQLPHRFFASVNGDMIWSGVELARATGNADYLTGGDRVGTGRRRPTSPIPPASSPTCRPRTTSSSRWSRGCTRSRREEHVSFARTWILDNAAAALSARAPDGAYGRFFDGPAPKTTVTAWQTSGGFALELAAAALDPKGIVRVSDRWTSAQSVTQTLAPGDTVTFTGSEIAFYGSLGEVCCEPGHARVFVDGRQTFDRTGIWQNKSSSGLTIPDTVLFAWRWPKPGRHTISFAPGITNGKEGGSYLELTSYVVG